MVDMHFASFIALSLLSLLAALVVHFGFRYRVLDGFDGFLWKWVIGWLGAWVGTPVLGMWFDGFKVGRLENTLASRRIAWGWAPSLGGGQTNG